MHYSWLIACLIQFAHCQYASNQITSSELLLQEPHDETYTEVGNVESHNKTKKKSKDELPLAEKQFKNDWYITFGTNWDVDKAYNEAGSEMMKEKHHGKTNDLENDKKGSFHVTLGGNFDNFKVSELLEKDSEKHKTKNKIIIPVEPPVQPPPPPMPPIVPTFIPVPQIQFVQEPRLVSEPCYVYQYNTVARTFVKAKRKGHTKAMLLPRVKSQHEHSKVIDYSKTKSTDFTIGKKTYQSTVGFNHQLVVKPREGQYPGSMDECVALEGSSGRMMPNYMYSEGYPLPEPLNSLVQTESYRDDYSFHYIQPNYAYPRQNQYLRTESYNPVFDPSYDPRQYQNNMPRTDSYYNNGQVGSSPKFDHRNIDMDALKDYFAEFPLIPNPRIFNVYG